jgi:hypothetical protein
LPATRCRMVFRLGVPSPGILARVLGRNGTLGLIAVGPDLFRALGDWRCFMLPLL